MMPKLSMKLVRIGTAEMMALSPLILKSIPLTPTLSPEGRGSATDGCRATIMSYVMPQPNDVVMIDRLGGIRLSDEPNSSSKPGYAMKADPPKMRSIIGKAMEPLEEGEGEILIFVTRQ